MNDYLDRRETTLDQIYGEIETGDTELATVKEVTETRGKVRDLISSVGEGMINGASLTLASIGAILNGNKLRETAAEFTMELEQIVEEAYLTHQYTRAELRRLEAALMAIVEIIVDGKHDTAESLLAFHPPIHPTKAEVIRDIHLSLPLRRTLGRDNVYLIGQLVTGIRNGFKSDGSQISTNNPDMKLAA